MIFASFRDFQLERDRPTNQPTRGNAVKGGIESETRLHALNMMKRYTFFFLYETFFIKDMMLRFSENLRTK